MASTDTGNGRRFAEMNEADWKQQELDDDAAMRDLLANAASGEGDAMSFLPDPDHQETKADNAIDFEDISDDDLPDEEGTTNRPPTASSDTVPGTAMPVEPAGADPSGDTDMVFDDDFDDLFGGPVGEIDVVEPAEPSKFPSSSLAITNHAAASSTPGPEPSGTRAESDSELADMLGDMMEHGPMSPKCSEPQPTLEELREMNFPSNQDDRIPDTYDNVDNFLKARFPGWSRDRLINWNRLFPTNEASIKERKPTKPPKPLKLTKLSLEIAADQQAQFRVSDVQEESLREKYAELVQRRLVPLFLAEEEAASEISDVDLNDEDGDDRVAGFSLLDLEALCADWSDFDDAATPSLTADRSPSRDGDNVGFGEDQDQDQDQDQDEDDEWERLMADQRPAKRTKYDTSLPQLSSYANPTTLDNYEAVTQQHSKQVVIDLNDPHMLIDDSVEQWESPVHAQKPQLNPSSRFGASFEDPYSLIKHHGARGSCHTVNVDHSLPALRLSWPYYLARVPLEKLFIEDLHRPLLKLHQSVNRTLQWAPRLKRDRKKLKGMKVPDIFQKSSDLTLNDNSTAVCIEFCEQFPIMLSKFGMGNRVLNYYRKRKNESESPNARKRAKNELGEPTILLPHAQSPFSIFGAIEQGETLPTLHNQMFRAPLFKHTPRRTDFIMGRTTTNATGHMYYLRPLEHIFVAGQQFPDMEVPGPHSRKVTNATKMRIQMLAYRLIRKSDHGAFSPALMIKHLKESTEVQNRQKLKEFLSYDKDKKEWHLKENQTLMSEEEIRALLKPEDVCLIDSMHIGLGTMDDEDIRRNLKKKQGGDAEEHAEEDKEESFASKMAPWKITRSFIDATKNKAMVELHGEGDPTGHGYGFSFIRTSMKGGYIEAVQGPNATSMDVIERERKANNGHSYNVKKQEQMYMSAIKDIWNKQKATLSDETLHDDMDTLQMADDDDERFHASANNGTVATPGVAATPAGGMYDGMSQISRTTGTSRGLHGHETLRIVRTRKNPGSKEVETHESIITDPAVAKMYQRKRRQITKLNIDVYSARPTGNSEFDGQQCEMIDRELLRLCKNKERRFVREKQRGLKSSIDDGEASTDISFASGLNNDASAKTAVPPTTNIRGGTSRKCANCGMIGHIKTNKKLCPLFKG